MPARRLKALRRLAHLKEFVLHKFALTVAVAVAASVLGACSDRSTAENVGEENAAAETGPNGNAPNASESRTGQSSGVLDANIATAEQLKGVPGVTPELAEAIVAGRPYATVAELNKKLGESAPQAAKTVLENVFVPVNLNTATRAEIGLIPGISDRMVGEFLEYRPYEDMAEFDREIGKYVDEAEVARFRRYVTL